MRARRGCPGPLLAGLVALGAASPLGAQARGGWTPDERVTISDFSTIVGVAGDRWRIYAATPAGLLTWDPARGAWGLPLTIEDGYPVAEQPSALAWSETEQALVLGTRAGRLWRVDALAGRADPLGAVPGAVERMVATSAGDLYLQTGAGWQVLQAGSMIPRAVGRPPAELLAERDEQLRSLEGVLGLDQRLRRWPVTAVARGTRPDEYYVGTAGGGLLHVDGRTLQVDPLAYGATTTAVTALARVGGRIWLGGVRAERGRASVSATDTSLQHWLWPDQLRDGAPSADVATMAALGADLWVGAADGLYRLSGDRWTRYGTGDGLPSNPVTALATSDSALWVGTRAGACLWRGQRCGPTLLPGERVTALAWCDRTLWIGTSDALWRATAAELVRADVTGVDRVQSLACLRGSLYVAGPRALVVQENGTWRPPLPLGGSGTVRTMTAADSAVWVGGDAGVARWDPRAAAWDSYLVPHDVPYGPVLGVLPLGRQLWLATPAGALRLDLRDR